MREIIAAEDLFFAAFGPAWRAGAPVALGRSRRSVERYAAGQRVPGMVQRRLADAMARPEAIEAWAAAERARIEALAAEWEAAAINLRTRLKEMTIEDERNPPSRGGRPKKRHPRPLWLNPLPRAARVPAPPAPRPPTAYRPLPATPAGR